MLVDHTWTDPLDLLKWRGKIEQNFDFHAGNIKFITQNEEWLNLRKQSFNYKFSCFFDKYHVR